MEKRKVKVNDKLYLAKIIILKDFFRLKITKIINFFSLRHSKKVSNCNRFMNKELCKHKSTAEIM